MVSDQPTGRPQTIDKTKPCWQYVDLPRCGLTRNPIATGIDRHIAKDPHVLTLDVDRWLERCATGSIEIVPNTLCAHNQLRRRRPPQHGIGQIQGHQRGHVRSIEAATQAAVAALTSCSRCLIAVIKTMSLTTNKTKPTFATGIFRHRLPSIRAGDGPDLLTSAHAPCISRVGQHLAQLALAVVLLVYLH